MQAGTIVRIALIGLGIASAVLLAHSAFGIRFNEDFLLLLELMRNFIGVVVLPFELLIVSPVVRWLHEQGLVFQLRHHWHNAFVLLWLFNASAMRAYAPPSRILGGAGTGVAVRVAFRWTWGALAALLGGALAGTVPLDHPAVLWWPLAAFFLYWSGDAFIYAFKDRLTAIHGALCLALVVPFAALALGWVKPLAMVDQPPLFWWPAAAWFAWWASNGLIWAAVGRDVSANLAGAVLWLAFAGVAGALALGIVPGPAWLKFEHSPSPGLANLAAFVVTLAAYYLLRAVVVPERREGSYLKRVFDDSAALTGLDILSVLGGAAIIVYLAHLLA